MNTYSEYKDLQSKQNTIVDMLSDKLNSYPKGDFGMIEESVRVSDEELAEITKAAAAKKQPIASWMRQVCVKAAKSINARAK